MTKSVLFVCNMNSVRSPMAAALLRAKAGDRLRIDSAGVYKGGFDPFVEVVMGEIGILMQGHQPKQLSEEGADDFDLVVALTPEADAEARQLLPGKRVECWPIDNPSLERGGREAVVAAYRRARDQIHSKLAAQFPEFF